MSFSRIQKGTFAAHKGHVRRVSISCSSGKHLAIHLSADVYALIGNPPKVNLFLGEGIDSGKVRVYPNNNDGTGYSVNHKKNANGTSRNSAIIGLYPGRLGLPNVKQKMTQLKFSATTEYVEFELPKLMKG